MKIDPEARFIAVGFVLGIVLILFFVGLAHVLDLRTGFFGVPPRVHHFLG